ncbi:imelysin family protein [Xinfangfangia sp. D13-10-4-6]|uniref:imelysin family protein n=1 Tax=Pseudogemmobacter hezensis TaxID=2737662 RepID=UPI00155727BA|nr:imelysin family protein [Pseudogemmobacter hezensis]NPD17122.1 imelysin family protein [Pseudogemmobacter hezensis]
MSRLSFAALVLATLGASFGPGPARADMDQAVRGVIIPAYAGFARAAAALNDEVTAQFDSSGTCNPEALRPAYNKAFDAWMSVSWLHFGPSEDEGRGLAIRFWPDPKGLGAKAQRALLIGDPANLQPEKFAVQSVAARGLTGLERLLYPGAEPEADPCPLIRATTTDMAALADALVQGWGESADAPGFARALLQPGSEAPGSEESPRYRNQTEALQALFTQLMGGLEFIADQRLGRPLGSDDKPRPERAEARASGRATRNISLELQSIRRLVAGLEPGAEATLQALDRAISEAGRLNEPQMAGVSDPARRKQILLLQRYVRAARATALSEMAPALGVGLGFNSQDGD